MKQYRVNERQWIVGNFEVRKNANGEKRFYGDFRVLKRTASNRWSVGVPINPEGFHFRFPDGTPSHGGVIDRTFYETRKAALEAARQQIEKADA